MNLYGGERGVGVALTGTISRSHLVLAVCTVLVAVQRCAVPFSGVGMGHCREPGPMDIRGGSGCGTQYSVLREDTVPYMKLSATRLKMPSNINSRLIRYFRICRFLCSVLGLEYSLNRWILMLDSLLVDSSLVHA